MYYLGIDLGGTHMAVGVVNKEGAILVKAETPTLPERPYQELVADMVKCMRAAMAEANVTENDIHSIGIGIPGVADTNGVVVFCTNLSWHNIPLRAEIQKYINKPVFIDNDANVAGWAEYAAGVSRGTDTSVFLTLGTGVGAGIVINGKLWKGRHNVAAEYRRTRNKYLRSCFPNLFHIGKADSAVHLNIVGCGTLFPMFCQFRYLLYTRRNQLLTAEARFHRHNQYAVQILFHFFQNRNRCVRLNGNADTNPQFLYL